MEFIYKNQILNTEDLKYLGGNLEGNIFAYQDEAIKIYHDIPSKLVLSKDDCEYFTSIKTNRILLPTRLVYSLNGHNYCGYAEKLVQEPVPISCIHETLEDCLDDEKAALEEDKAILASAKIRLRDLDAAGNCLYNGSLYFCDAGSYNRNMDDVRQANDEELNYALHYHIFMLGKDKDELEREFSQIMDTDYYFSEDFYNLLTRIYEDAYANNLSAEDYFTFITNILYDYGSIMEYKKSLIEKVAENGTYDDSYYESAKELKRFI